MRGDELRNVDADGSDFLFGDVPAGERPDAGAFADALRGDSEIFAGEDEGFFDEADEVDGAEVWAFFAGKVSAEIEDGIADELAGAVVRDVSAALGLVDFDVLLREFGISCEDVGARGVAAKREDGRVLEQQECVCDEAGFARGDNFSLEAKAFGVAYAAEMKEVEMHGAIQVYDLRAGTEIMVNVLLLLTEGAEAFRPLETIKKIVGFSPGGAAAAIQRTEAS